MHSCQKNAALPKANGSEAAQQRFGWTIGDGADHGRHDDQEKKHMQMKAAVSKSNADSNGVTTTQQSQHS